MKKTKKMTNDPEAVVTEMLEGLVLAYDGTVKRLEGEDASKRTDVPEGAVLGNIFVLTQASDPSAIRPRAA